jgi:hypothetical protein
MQFKDVGGLYLPLVLLSLILGAALYSFHTYNTDKCSQLR